MKSYKNRTILKGATFLLENEILARTCLFEYQEIHLDLKYGFQIHDYNKEIAMDSVTLLVKKTEDTIKWTRIACY